MEGEQSRTGQVKGWCVCGGAGGGAVFCGVMRECLTEKVAFSQRPGGEEGAAQWQLSVEEGQVWDPEGGAGQRVQAGRVAQGGAEGARGRVWETAQRWPAQTRGG